MLLAIVDKYDSIIVQSRDRVFEDYEGSRPLRNTLTTKPAFLIQDIYRVIQKWVEKDHEYDLVCLSAPFSRNAVQALLLL